MLENPKDIHEFICSLLFKGLGAKIERVCGDAD
jgi:hypothetical protein